MRFASVLLIATVDLSQPSATIAQSSDLPARIRTFEAGFDAANRISGVLLITRGDSVVLNHAFGHADPIRGTPNQLSTPFPVASITKIFTVVALTQMVLEGKVRLDDRLSRWLPDFPRASEITVGQLVNHRAGIRHRVTEYDDERSRHSAEDMTRLAARFALIHEPGPVSAYSTAGYAVLARVLEVADGRRFDEILAARVFGPAGMRGCFDMVSQSPPAKPVDAFLPLDGRLVPAPPRHLSYLVGGGSSVCTANDLLLFARALRRDGIGRVTFAAVAPGGSARWIGATAGYFGWVDVLPADDMTVVFLGNTWGGAATALRDVLPALLRGESPAPPVIPTRAPSPVAAQLATFAGAYETRPGASSIARVDGGHLRLDDNYLVPISDGRFWHPSFNAEVRFVRDSSAAVVAIERGTGANAARWPRVRAPTLVASARFVSADASDATIELNGRRWMGLRAVPTGAFEMGTSLSLDSIQRRLGLPPLQDTLMRPRVVPRPARVTLSTVSWMGQYEVTVAQFEDFVNATSYVTDAERAGWGMQWNGSRFVRAAGRNWRNPGYPLRPNLPVSMVTWNDASAFTAWLSRVTGRVVRLPSEAEWEYAARANGRGLFGDAETVEDLAQFARFGFGGDSSGWRPDTVGSKRPNAFGLHDMLGNLWEWNADCYAATAAVAFTRPANDACNSRVIRGGSWLNGPASLLPFFRASDSPTLVEPHFGFRVLVER